MSHVFPRRTSGTTPIAVRAEGVWITDAEGNRYLDAAGGAVVVNLGHGDRDIARVMSTQAERLAYAHATAFTTDVLEMYVRRYPGLWLWMHRRWRDVETSSDEDRGMFPAATREEE